AGIEVSRSDRARRQWRSAGADVHARIGAQQALHAGVRRGAPCAARMDHARREADGRCDCRIMRDVQAEAWRALRLRAEFRARALRFTRLSTRAVARLHGASRPARSTGNERFWPTSTLAAEGGGSAARRLSAIAFAIQAIPSHMQMNASGHASTRG